MNRNHTLCTTSQVAELAHVNPETVRRWADAGQLPVAIVTPGGHRRYLRSDVDALLRPVGAR